MTQFTDKKPAKPKAGHSTGQSELKTRVLSAAILAPIAILLAYYSFASFLFLIGIIILALSWEWGRMTRGNGLDPIALLTAVTALTMMGAIVWQDFRLVWGILLLGVLSTYLLAGKHRLWAAAGVLYICLPVVAMVWLRSDEQYGFVAIAFVFFVVWTTDSASYGAGRLVGGVKFAPSISPNKN